ncbi:lysophospholipid acyltransferase 7 isoform X2 [Anabrus simplex]
MASFAFQFSYLLFFRTTVYFGIPYPPGHTNLVQMMITLKLVGLAFEAHDSATKHSKVNESESSAVSAEKEATIIDPGFWDIFHYAFCYVGVLTGPYYRYRTYWDWLHSPFSTSADCLGATLQKLKHVPIFAGLFLLVSYLCPLKYSESEEFYTERSVLYRLWYVNPMFFIFRMRIYTGLTLSECVCTMAGLGAYPVVTEPKSGLGPSKEYETLKEIASDPKRAEKEQYNFVAIHNIDPYGTERVVTFREAMKTWNSCIQYWLAVNVYKRFPFKPLRTWATVFVSAYWHGVYAGYYLCICSAPTYLPVEDLYVKLILKQTSGLAATLWGFIFRFFKMQAFAYMAVAFYMLEIGKTFYYWKSIYFAWHLLWIFLYAVGFLIAKNRKKMEKLSKQQ